MKCKAMKATGAGRAGMHTIEGCTERQFACANCRRGGSLLVAAGRRAPIPSASRASGIDLGRYSVHPPVYTVDQRSVNNVFRRAHNAGQPPAMALAKARGGGN